MLEDEGEDDALARLVWDLKERRCYPKPSHNDACKLAQTWVTIPDVPPGHVPYYFDGVLCSYTLKELGDNLTRLSVYRDGEETARVCVALQHNRLSTRGSQVLVGNKYAIDSNGFVSQRGSMSSLEWRAELTKSGFANDVEKWYISKAGSPADFQSDSPLLKRARGILAAQIKEAVDAKLKPLELTIETLQLRASFRDTGLAHLLQPLPFIPHKRVVAKTIEDASGIYHLGGNVHIYLFGKATYLQTQAGLVRDLHLPHPDAWTLSGRWLSVFVGSESYVFNTRDGSLVDRPANPTHYIDRRTILATRGRIRFCFGSWHL